MAASNKLLGKFCTAIKQMEKGKVHAPWSFVKTTQVVYDENLYGHSFRTGTMPTTVKLYPAIIKAVEMYKGGARYHADAPDYLMISRPASWSVNGSNVKGKEYFLEQLYQDGSSTLIHKRGNTIRVSDMEPDGTNSPVGEFKALNEYQLAGIIQVCLPEILEEDNKSASGKLAQAIADLNSFASEFSAWHDEAEIPDLAKESAFFMDAIFCYCNDRAQWYFADPNDPFAMIAEQVDTLSLGSQFKGSEVVCSNPNVSFRYVVTNGSKDGGVGKAMTIGEAKAEFSVFSSHRNWTAAEKMMIPFFSDDTPVMPETIRIARRIVGTRNAVNPVENIMWRGVTSYGKSTGVKQLACILNIPLMILTCHPGMEISEFKSTFVPESEEDGLEADPLNICFTKDDHADMSADLKMAVDHVSHMEREEREAFLSGTGFYMEAMMDAESAAYSLLGQETQMDTEELCRLYSDTVCYFREKPLRIKIAQLETDEPEDAQKQEQKPGFKHVMSPYMKALINGYLVEIQEPSRIRDSGVLVGINEYDRAGAVVHLMNGAMARRHKDALVIMTDNVGYASCRPIDPSVLRRQGMIIDSYELSEQLLKDRTRRNTGCKDTALLNRCYSLWNTVKEYCEVNSITEGSVSPMELERLVQAVMLDGEDSLEENLADCVISKATSSIEDQRDIKTACGLS